MSTRPDSANLLCWWPFDGDANDSHGDTDLTESNSPAYVSGKTGQAVDLEWTSSQYLNVGAPNDAQVSENDFTITGWLKGESWYVKGDYNMVWRTGNGPTSGGVLLRMAREVAETDATMAASLFGSVGDPGESTIHSNTQVAIATWYFFAVVHDVSEKTWTLYGDAATPGTVAQEATDTYSHTVAAAPFGLTIGYSWTTWYFDGIFEDFTVWDAVLSLDELQYLNGDGDGLSYADYMAAEASGNYNKVDLSLGVRL